MNYEASKIGVAALSVPLNRVWGEEEEAGSAVGRGREEAAKVFAKASCRAFRVWMKCFGKARMSRPDIEVGGSGVW